MKIELVFCKRSKGFDCLETLIIGKFRTKKAAYQYVKTNRKFFCEGFFAIDIYKNYSYYSEPVRAQDILNVSDYSERKKNHGKED